MNGLSEINSLTDTEFAFKFHNIVECCPNVGKQLAKKRPFHNIQNITEEACRIIHNLDDFEKETILKLHPDLAGRLADEGKLTLESVQEQAAAGLGSITAEDKRMLRELNQMYRKKFGFPFVICARENKFNAIVEGLKVRLNNKKEEELRVGTDEVKKICKLRILDLVESFK